MSIRSIHQCEFVKENGVRCKRKSTYPHFCWQHLALVDHVKIKKSGIRNSGKGLFTLIDLKKGKNFPYEGEIVETNDENYGGDYVLQITKTNPKKYIDAAKTDSCLGRYCNTCRKQQQQNHECSGNNSALKPYGRNKASVKLKKNVKAGSEILASYGRTYFNPRS
jgi:hypothetical protein